jgi:3-hydroxyacyl-CoA dehydrogenase
VAFALDVITSGRMVSSTEALTEKLVDAIVPPNLSLEQVAIQWAKWGYFLGPDVLRNTRKLQFRAISPRNEPKNHQLCQEYKIRKLPPISQGGEAKQMAVCAIQASFQSETFEEGLCSEEALFQDLLYNSKQGRALRYAFFAERSAQHYKDVNPSTDGQMLVVRHIGVIGAGTMGSGIAISLLLANYDVTLVDVNPSSLAKGVSLVQATVAKRRHTNKATGNSNNNSEPKLSSSTDISVLASCQVIIEAVFEDMKLKQDIFAQLSKLTSDTNALLLTNTSTLDISKIFANVSTTKLSSCCGMHFFSPAHVMRLVEIVVDANTTSDRTIQAVKRICKKMNKIGVVVGNCDGFVGNRMIHPYTTESVLCLEEGSTTVMEVDKALQNFGMALGPFAMSDLAGNDIGYVHA